jgi:hypothetical protein
MNKDVMNQGVQILLDRMDTNPEEFEDYSGRWGDIIGAVHARKSIPAGHSKDAPLPFLTDPEVNALYDKLEDVRRENFTADVLRRLADTPREQIQEDLFDSRSYSTSNIPLGGGALTSTTGAVGTWGKSSVTLAEVQALNEERKQQIIDAMTELNKARQSKRKATAR